MLPPHSSIPSTPTDLSKGIRIAQALYESDYDDRYVMNALYEKGFDHKQTIWIMRSAELENVQHRKKGARNGTIIFGGAWIVILSLLFFTADTPERPGEMQIPMRWWLIAAGTFLAALGTYVYAAVQVSRVKKKLPADPSGIEENAVP